jgi:dipeptidyl aminopeptidase/acylaminoacyl peptidase
LPQLNTDVPYEQSVFMDQALAHQGVPHEFVSVPDGGHGLGNSDRDVLAGIYRKAVAFIGRYTA